MTGADLQRLVGKRVLITGGTGFIGSHLSDLISRTDAELIVVSRTARSRADVSGEWLRADLADMRTTEDIVQSVEPDLIFHLASYVSGSRELSAVQSTLRNNLLTTVNLLTALGGISFDRVILAGSMEEPAPGDPRRFPCSPYAASKWACSGYARMFHHLYGMPIAIARIFMVYGPGQRDLRKLIPYVILSLLKNETPRLSSGKRPVDWIYVEDVVGGLLSMGIAPGIDGQALDLGSGQMITIGDVVRRIFDLVETDLEPRFGALPDRAFEQVRVADTESTARKLGWQASTPLDMGLRKTVEWYAEAYRTSLAR
jgi:nucleoside-diphosphate-sugar epimerase